MQLNEPTKKPDIYADKKLQFDVFRSELTLNDILEYEQIFFTSNINIF